MEKQFFKPAFARLVHLFLYSDIIRGSAYISKLKFKNCLCDSQECLEFVRRLFDCSVLRGELFFMFQVFDLCDYWIVPFSGTTLFCVWLGSHRFN